MTNLTSAAVVVDGDSFFQGFFNDLSGIVQVTAGENLTAGWVVYIKRSDGKAYQSDTNTTDDIRADGMVIATVLSGATVKVQTRGIFSGSSGLTSGTQYYLGASGTLSATASGVKMGVATSTTAIWLDIHDDKEAMIGTIKPWHKSISGLPNNTLTAYWHECSSSAISDAESPLNGQTINLNTTPRFIRGNTTSGTTGGEDTHTLTIGEMPAHTHDFDAANGAGSVSNSASRSAATSGVTTSQSTGGGTAHENRPAYMEMVWIIKKK